MTENERAACEYNKQFFMHYWSWLADRPGAAECLAWLENETDYFTAPASRKYHGAHPGGLLTHSINVCAELLELLKNHGVTEVREESAILAALLHDVCKCNYYQEINDTVAAYSHDTEIARHVIRQGYEIEDTLPLGHGEKSLYLLMRTGLQLTEEEAAAIRWHMGAYCDRDQTRTMSQAFERYPLALFLHMADMIASKYIETEARTDG